MPNLKITSIFVISTFMLSACQTETVTEAAATAPVAAPAKPAPKMAAQTATGPLLSGPVAVAGGQWDRGTSGFTLVGMVRENNGKVAVCGVRHEYGKNPRGLNSKVMGQYKFYVGDKFIRRGAQHFAAAKSDAAIPSTPVSCASTNIPWNPEYAKGPWSLKKSGTSSF